MITIHLKTYYFILNLNFGEIKHQEFLSNPNLHPKQGKAFNWTGVRLKDDRKMIKIYFLIFFIFLIFFKYYYNKII
jgi:hypothetical protein